MRQLFQAVNNGEVLCLQVPCPAPMAGGLLIQTTASLISAGTERMLLEFGQASLLQKARLQPDKVRQALDKVRADGLWPTLQSIRSKLDQPIALGYCNVGRVVEADGLQPEFSQGDRVVSNGGHAEMVAVPRNLCAKIPDGVSDEAAAYTVLAAIGLQGIRLAQPTLGETVVVTGLGLIGLLTVQLLRANGCRVIGIDLNPQRLALAAELGAEVIDAGQDPPARARQLTDGRGVDAVLITASTRSDAPVRQAAQMCRQRGRIVLIGVAGLQLSRADFYEKELSFQVSCSYGPGRYDPAYEHRGLDYPLGLVRWTEQRNFAAALQLMADGAIDPTRLTSQRIPFGEAAEAYRLVQQNRSLGILLQFADADPQFLQARTIGAFGDEVSPSQTPRKDLQTTTSGSCSSSSGAAASRRDISAGASSSSSAGASPSRVRVAVIGAGNFAARVLIPALRESGARIAAIASRNGASAALQARKHRADATTDAAQLIHRPDIDAVVIATRHDSHASFVGQCLEAGKPVFVEKPLAIDRSQLVALQRDHEAAPRPMVMVGFNRRFAPLVQRMQRLLEATAAPRLIHMMVNAGSIPADHWVHDVAVGGGRIIGEGCHFVDLGRHLAAAPITSVAAQAIGQSPDGLLDDKATIELRFANGSLATIHYWGNGHRAVPKERIEVFVAGRVLQLDNYRRLRGFGWKGFRKHGLWIQDKGQAAGVRAFLQAVGSQGPPPIAWDELWEVSQATLDAATAVRSEAAPRQQQQQAA